MSFLDLTPGSTGATNAAVTLYMPPAEAANVLIYLDGFQAQQRELERLHARLQRLTPDPANARACRTDAIEALVLAALDNATLRADVLDSTRCRRTTKVREHLRENKDNRYDIDKPPTRESVRKVLMKHGYV